jgi:hypothetical protein
VTEASGPEFLTPTGRPRRAGGGAIPTEETPHTAAQRLAQQRVLAAVQLRRKLPIDTTPEPL